jgi:hypothetical protein
MHAVELAAVKAGRAEGRVDLLRLVVGESGVPQAADGVVQQLRSALGLVIDDTHVGNPAAVALEQGKVPDSPCGPLIARLLVVHAAAAAAGPLVLVSATGKSQSQQQCCHMPTNDMHVVIVAIPRRGVLCLCCAVHTPWG